MTAEECERQDALEEQRKRNLFATLGPLIFITVQFFLAGAVNLFLLNRLGRYAFLTLPFVLIAFTAVVVIVLRGENQNQDI